MRRVSPLIYEQPLDDGQAVILLSNVHEVGGALEAHVVDVGRLKAAGWPAFVGVHTDAGALRRPWKRSDMRAGFRGSTGWKPEDKGVAIVVDCLLEDVHVLAGLKQGGESVISDEVVEESDSAGHRH